MGFGIALYALLPGDVLFSSSLRTVLTLYRAALGDPNFDLLMDIDDPFAHLGQLLIALFTAIAFIVFLNFVVARIIVSVLFLLTYHSHGF